MCDESTLAQQKPISLLHHEEGGTFKARSKMKCEPKLQEMEVDLFV